MLTKLLTQRHCNHGPDCMVTCTIRELLSLGSDQYILTELQSVFWEFRQVKFEIIALSCCLAIWYNNKRHPMIPCRSLTPREFIWVDLLCSWTRYTHSHADCTSSIFKYYRVLKLWRWMLQMRCVSDEVVTSISHIIIPAGTHTICPPTDIQTHTTGFNLTLFSVCLIPPPPAYHNRADSVWPRDSEIITVLSDFSAQK